MQISLNTEVAQKLHALLEQEGEDAVFRIRETKSGCGCKSKIKLRLSLDEREDEDVEVEVDSMPFVANEELVTQYGSSYSVTLDEHGIPAEVTALTQA